MKKSAYLLMATILGSCQPKTKPPLAAAIGAVAAVPNPTALKRVSLALPVWHGNVVRGGVTPQLIMDTLESRRFFQRYDLTPILQTVTESKEAYPLNGFRGAEKYRTEVVIVQTFRNAHNPAAYAIAGLSRTKRHITHFAGEILFEKVSREPMLTAADKQNIRNFSAFILPIVAGEEPVARYAVAGRVVLQEADSQATSKIFTGSVVLELALTTNGCIVLDSPFLRGPSQGGGLKYEGAWAASPISQPEPAVWVEDIIGYSPHIFGDLAIGEREVSFNPKYAKLGWNNYWENDEWWATSLAPKLSL